MKTLLKKIVGSHHLSFDELSTILTEAEATPATYTHGLHTFGWFIYTHSWSLPYRTTTSRPTYLSRHHLKRVDPQTVELSEEALSRFMDQMDPRLPPTIAEKITLEDSQ